MSSESFRQQQQQQLRQSNLLVNDHVDKWKLEPGARLIQKIRQNAGSFTAGFISLLAFISPILMAGLPKLGALEMKSQQVRAEFNLVKTYRLDSHKVDFF